MTSFTAAPGQVQLLYAEYNSPSTVTELLGTTQVAVSSSAFTFSDLQINKVGTYRFLVTSAELEVISDEFAIVPGACTALELSELTDMDMGDS